MDEEEYDYDDAPHVTDPSLVGEDSAYQTILKHRDDLSHCKDIFYKAFSDIIQSDEKNKSSCMDYFIEMGVPFRYRDEKKYPFTTLIANRITDPELFSMLVVCKYYEIDMNLKNNNGKSAVDILTEKCPAMLTALKFVNMEEFWTSDD